jgi:putative transposase
MKKNNQKLYGYQTTNRAKHNLKIHLIFVCKYRKKLLYGELDSLLKVVIRDIEQKSDFKIIEMEIDKDHIHLMIQYIPRVSISSIVNRLKSITTYHLWKKYKPFLKQHFWKENTFWTDGYFECSVGEASPESIRKYIQNQG